MLPTAHAAGLCEEKAAPYRAELEAGAAKAIAEIDNGIAEIRKGGGDPGKIAVRIHDGTFKSLPELKGQLMAQKSAALQEIDKAVAGCEDDMKPLQDVTDASVTLLTGGLSKILPPRMTHIDIGQILGGKPFGGNGAVIPHLREQILGALGLKDDRGFIVKFVRDPIHALFPHF